MQNIVNTTRPPPLGGHQRQLAMAQQARKQLLLQVMHACKQR
jgi:hypothetical protein